MLQDFDAGQIKEFLKLWHRITFSDHEEAERKRQRLAKAIADSRPIKLLAGNPLLLTLMAIINRKEELPRNRARLYEKAAELLLQQWDTEAKLLPDFPSLSAEIDLRAKAAILRKVALEMQTAGSNAANLIQGERLIKLIEEYLREELHFDKARQAANALVDQLRERNFILCFLGGDSYGFVHRTFLEYFCATEYVHQFEKKRSLDIDGLLALYDQHCREDDWQEVLRLICGQLEEHKVDNEWIVEKIIEHLTGLVDLEAWDKKSPLPELLLAVCCLSEVKNLKKTREKTGGDLIIKVIDYILLFKEELNIRSEIFKAIFTVGFEWPGKNMFYFSGQHPSHKRNSAIWVLILIDIFRKEAWIEQLCLSDIHFVREAAFEMLIHGLDYDTKYLFENFSSSSGTAASLHGKNHSFFGKIVFQKKFVINNPLYYDPRNPIPAKHIQKAAEKAGIPPDKLDEAVRSLSAHMGWDITKGSLAGKL